MNIPTINCTKDYQKFQVFKENRETTEAHIKKFINDPTFPKKFPMSPIVVDKSFRIIDGQHRFSAAKKLNIPIYYIVDSDCDLCDIISRNTQVKKWNSLDFVKFYALQGNSDYKFLLNLVEKHSINFSHLVPILNATVGELYKDLLQRGKIKLSLEEQFQVENFCNLIFPIIKTMKSCRSDEAYRVVLSKPYLRSLARLYLEESRLLNKFLEKAPTCPKEFFISVTLIDDAISQIGKISRWSQKTSRD